MKKQVSILAVAAALMLAQPAQARPVEMDQTTILELQAAMAA